jgi:plastocyanin
MPRFSNGPCRAAGHAVLLLSLTLAGTPTMAMSHAAGPDALTVAARPGEIVIDNFRFAPSTLTVAAGTAVVWTNRDGTPHTIVSSDGRRLFKSAPLDTNDAFRFVFNEPGTYHYFCSLHPMMQGTILVR